LTDISGLRGEYGIYGGFPEWVRYRLEAWSQEKQRRREKAQMRKHLHVQGISVKGVRELWRGVEVVRVNLEKQTKILLETEGGEGYEKGAGPGWFTGVKESEPQVDGSRLVRWTIINVLNNSFPSAGGGRQKWSLREYGMDIYTLLYLKWITNKDLLCSIGNSAQCYVAAWMKRSLGENGYMYMYD